MAIILQIIFGMYAGWMLCKPGDNKFLHMTLAVLGAMGANVLLNTFGLPGVSSINFYSFLAALAGGTVVIEIARLLQSGAAQRNSKDLLQN